MKNMTRTLGAGLIAAAPFFLTAPVHAQSQQYTPRISGFNVDEVRRIYPGVELNFDVYGTPGGTAVLHIAGANRNLVLTETEPGQYEGTYTVGSRDHINAQSAVTANLRVGNQVASGVLSESLLRNVGYHARAHNYAPAPGLKIDRFDVAGNDSLSPGNELDFTVYGTPGARVDLAIEGGRGTLFLPEVKPGEYSGSYIIRGRDRIASNSNVTANLRVGDRVTTATLGKPLQVAAATPASAVRVARYCSNCATVEAVNVVEVNGNGNYLGALGGGVVGALLGSQVGSGNGRTAAEVAGAVGGAYAGRNIERNSSRTQHYEVTVRYPGGGTQVLTYTTDPGFHSGDKVRINNGVLTRDQ